MARWTGTDGHQEQGYRTLASWLNRRILRTVYEEHGRTALDHRIEADYDALTGDDDLLGSEVEADLRADGSPATELADNLVSYGSVRTHLLDCLDGEKSPSSTETEWQRDSISIARTVATEKAQQALSALVSSGQVDDGEGLSVEVDIQLRCDKCPTVVPFDVAARRGYVCDTHSATDQSLTADQQ